MQEIKYKAWLKKEKKMVEVREINFASEQISFETKDDILFALFDEIELLQYIERTDKYGVEIFEGDIVKRTYNDGQYVELAVVEYDDYDCKFAFQGFNCDLDIHFNRLEVIGNIYENPELLEE